MPLIDFAPHNLTDNTNSPSPFVVTVSSQYNGTTLAAFRAFDGVFLQDGWVNNGGPTAWMEIDLGLGNNSQIHSYDVQVNNTPLPNRCPKDWALLGSADDINWDTLDTQTNQTSWGSGEKRTFVLSGGQTSISYRYFKLNITNNNGDPYTGIAELFLYAYEIFPTVLSNVVDSVTEIVAAHINKLEAKVGIDNSADANSLDYKVRHRPDFLVNQVFS